MEPAATRPPAWDVEQWCLAFVESTDDDDDKFDFEYDGILLYLTWVH